jgi:hypothetical protein
VKRDDLTLILAAKAATDRAAQLDARAETLSGSLSREAPPATVNPQATIVARLVGGAADMADAWLQIALSAMLELCVAATMINLERVRRRDDKPNTTAEPERPALPGSVSAFVAARLSLDGGGSADHRDIVNAYKDWCAASSPALAPLPAEMFGRQLAAECRRLGIAIRRQGDAIVCAGVRLGEAVQPGRLGTMYRKETV